MGFTFSTNITDILKGLSLVALVVLAIIYLPKFMGKMDNIGKPMDATTIAQITANVVKVTLVENNKALKEMLKELKDEDSRAIEEALANNETILELGKFMANMGSHTDSDPDIEKTPSGDSDGARDLEEFIIKRTDAEGKEFPTGIVRHSPNVKEGPKFSYQQFPLDFKVIVVGSEKDDEQNRYVEMWTESNFVKSSRGQKFPLKIDKNNVAWAKAVLKDKKFMWNTRIGLDGTFTNAVWYPGLGISLFSYGRTNVDMDWRFLGVSLGGDSANVYGGFTLFEYNFGKFMPLVENVFVGPNITYGISVEDDTQDNVSYGMKFSVPF